ITVATTRPETMLGDTAVAVHPDDARYQRLVGRNAILPLVGRRIPIVADGYSDPEKGTGAVKITPAHDFNDFEVGRRHNLPLVNVLDAEANLDLEGNEAFLRDVPSSADRKSTRLNSSHGSISYAVFCLKKKTKIYNLYASTSFILIQIHSDLVSVSASYSSSSSSYSPVTDTKSL